MHTRDRKDARFSQNTELGRGNQYASHEYQHLLAAHGVQSSMSRKANFWDNAVAPCFFATRKIELVYHSHWRTRTEARNEVFEYIELF